MAESVREFCVGYHVSIDGGINVSIKGQRTFVDKINTPEAPFKFVPAFQVFTKSPTTYTKSAISAADKVACKQLTTQQAAGSSSGQQLSPIKLFVHGCYLVNLSTPLESKYSSVVMDEMATCKDIGGIGVVYHVGKHCNRVTPARAVDIMIENIVHYLKSTPDGVKFILETGCNCGTEVCTTLDAYARISTKVDESGFGDRFSFCIDTCHIFAAGFDLNTFGDEFVEIPEK
jgi:deoxyribonuclease-4